MVSCNIFIYNGSSNVFGNRSSFFFFSLKFKFLIYPHESGLGPLLKLYVVGIHRVGGERQGNGVLGHQGLSCSQESHSNTAVYIPLLEDPGN